MRLARFFVGPNSFGQRRVRMNSHLQSHLLGPRWLLDVARVFVGPNSFGQRRVRMNSHLQSYMPPSIHIDRFAGDIGRFRKQEIHGLRNVLGRALAPQRGV
jgi:hypothetical protein